MGPIERKGSENLAKSGATAVDQSNLGQPPRRSFPGRTNIGSTRGAHIEASVATLLKTFFLNGRVITGLVALGLPENS